MRNQRVCGGLKTKASRRVLARACSGTAAMVLLEHLENRQLLSFGDDNLVIGPSLPDPPFIRPVEVGIGPGDKIVATGGNLLARFNADGTRDTGFGTDGVVTAALSRIYDVAVQGDGKIVIAGELNGQFAVARY